MRIVDSNYGDDVFFFIIWYCDVGYELLDIFVVVCYDVMEFVGFVMLCVKDGEGLNNKFSFEIFIWVYLGFDNVWI